MDSLRKIITKFIHFLMPHSMMGGCETHAVDLANMKDLTFLKRLKLRLHLWMCYRCYRYIEQLNLIEKSVRDGYKKKLDHLESHMEKDIIQKYSKKE